MAKVRSLKHIKKEIEKVEASIRKNARSAGAAKAKAKALKYLGKMKQSLEGECVPDPENPEDSFSAIPSSLLKTTTRKKGKAKK